MKFYKHIHTGRIVDEDYYKARLSNFVKGMFYLMENISEDEIIQSPIKPELLPEDDENFI